MGIKDAFKFLANGFSVWRDAALGQYQSSPEISRMREDFLNQELNRATDAQNLRQDWRMVARDCRIAFNKACQNIKPTSERPK